MAWYYILVLSKGTYVMNSMNTTIIVVEDDRDLREFLHEILTEQKYIVYTESKGSRALNLVKRIKPHLVILDLGLPDINGEDVCARIKEYYPSLPVIILTASDKSNDVVASFEKGADDYIKKPFINDELLARIRSKLKVHRDTNPEIQIADLAINTQSMEVMRDNKPIELTPTEFRLLQYLMLNVNQVLSRDQILNRVWAQDPDIDTRVVDVFIGYLRKKIDNGHKQKLIHSKRGFGYVLKDGL